jgi:hypothetical protein
MKIPADAIIPSEKLTRYLLVQRDWDDKSKFLGQAGFELASPGRLADAIRQLAAAGEAIEDRTDQWGTFFRVEGGLEGPNGLFLQVVLIWLQWKRDGSFHFVTLLPRKE